MPESPTTHPWLSRLSAALQGRYTLETELGSGGMAVVFRARDERHRRPVAVKVMRPEVALALGAERFLREIEMAARLQHPHILPLYDSGAADGFLFFVMPSVEGGSVRDKLNREQRLGIEDTVRIAVDVAAALDFAHSQNVLHRDIKPENIMLHAGEAVVADFGVAKAITDAGQQQLTGAGLLLGTPAYMSPEQASGDRPLDGRSDQYSLASVIYELLTGEPTFSGPSVTSVIIQRLADPVRPPTQLRADLPPDLEAALLRALSADPDQRFPTVREFALALAEGSGGAVRVSAIAAARSSGASQPQASIAVLPFADHSPGRENEYFSDGMTEEILNVLARMPTLRVAARTSVFAFKGKDEDVRSIGRKLGVTAVLEGSVRKAGPRVRIAVQLINAADGYQLWGDQYDRELTDVFALQDEIAGRIADALRVKLLGTTRRSASLQMPPDPEAYELYLKGRYHANRRTEAGLANAIEHYKDALARHPKYALALAGLADAYALVGIYGAAPPLEVMPQAKQAALQALDLDGSLAEARTSLGNVLATYDWNWTAAEDEFRQAMALAPQYPTVHQWYATTVLLPQRRFEEAEQRLSAARALDPLSAPIGTSCGLQYYFKRDYPRAVSEYLTTLDMDPHFAAAYYFLGQAYEQMGRKNDAVAELRRAVEESGSSVETRAALAHALATSGERREAASLLAKLVAEAERRYVAPSLIAQVHDGLGDPAAALDWLERAAEQRAADLVWLAVRPGFESVRGDERFRAILRRMGLS